MRVFISWSGTMSEQVAIALRDWLPSVIQSIKPYVSSEDIEKGARWSSDISKELEASDFGVLCITPSNTGAPWLNFEAGALSKSMDTARVVPFLYKLERASLPQGPLVQFQSVLATKPEVKKLVHSLNGACAGDALEEHRLDEIFEVWWPRLQQALEAIPAEVAKPSKSHRADEDILAELLELVRGQHQILNTPERLLPQGYLEMALDGKRPMERSDREVQVAGAAILDLFEGYRDLALLSGNGEITDRQRRAITRMAMPLRYMLRHGKDTSRDLQLSHHLGDAFEEMRRLGAEIEQDDD